MNSIDKNCIGYAHFKSGLDAQERYRRLPMVWQLSEWFIEQIELEANGIIALIQGSESDPLNIKQRSLVDHMIVVENGIAHCSHRREANAQITNGTLSKLIMEYTSDIYLYYKLYLVTKF